MSKKFKDKDSKYTEDDSAAETPTSLLIEILEWETLNKVSDSDKEKMGLYSGSVEVKNIKTLEEVTPGFDQVVDVDGRIIGGWGRVEIETPEAKPAPDEIKSEDTK